MPVLLDTHKRITSYPGGKILFSKLVGLKAPFFAHICPRVIELDAASSTIQIKDRRSIRNHIGTIHAGAMCTLAELAGGLALDAAIPPQLRWLPKGMTVAYIKKAKGTLTARCEFDRQIVQEGDIVVPIEVRDEENDIVFTAAITFYISPKKT